jgi:secreted trypsin-like serine protease
MFPKKEVSLSFHIIGGMIVEDPSEFPFIAILGYKSEQSGVQFEWNCGATLISNRFLLTAAHCIPRNNPPVVARLGTVNPEEPSQEYTIKRVIVHPDRKFTNYDDLALIELDGIVKFDENVSPACLYNRTEDLPTGTVFGAEGWGVTHPESELKALFKF